MIFWIYSSEDSMRKVSTYMYVSNLLAVRSDILNCTFRCSRIDEKNIWSFETVSEKIISEGNKVHFYKYRHCTKVVSSISEGKYNTGINMQIRFSKLIVSAFDPFSPLGVWGKPHKNYIKLNIKLLADFKHAFTVYSNLADFERKHHTYHFLNRCFSTFY